MRNMRNGWPLLINPLEYPFNRTPLFHEHYDWCLSCREKIKYIPVPSPYTRESIFHPLVLSKVRDNDLAGGRRVGSSRVGCSLLFISWSFVIVARRGALYVGTKTIPVKQLNQLIPRRQFSINCLPACKLDVVYIGFCFLHMPQYMNYPILHWMNVAFPMLILPGVLPHSLLWVECRGLYPAVVKRFYWLFCQRSQMYTHSDWKSISSPLACATSIFVGNTILSWGTVRELSKIFRLTPLQILSELAQWRYRSAHLAMHATI